MCNMDEIIHYVILMVRQRLLQSVKKSNYLGLGKIKSFWNSLAEYKTTKIFSLKLAENITASLTLKI